MSVAIAWLDAERSGKIRRMAQKPSEAESVETYLASLDHPEKGAILDLRRVVLGADPSIAEGIKWNTLSFRTSEYFATLHLRAKAGIGLVMHFGARKRDISTTGVAIDDPDELLQWLAKDRAMVTFRDADGVAARATAFTAILHQWIRHV